MACVYETPFLTLDQQTAELILQLQLEDAEVYFSSSKGKGREGDVSDEAFAFELQRQEIESMPLFCTDNRMARSMASAVVTDGQVLSESLFQEDNAVRDRDIAHQLSRGIEAPDRDYTRDNGEAKLMDNELLEKLRVLYVSGYDDGSQDGDPMELQSVAGNRPESSAWAAGRASKTSSTNRRCEACRENVKFVDVARLPCQHEYCRECLGQLFEASMTDETLFPPRCCRQPIPISSVRIFLKSELVREFAKKKIEFETSNRTYCHSPTCSTFIHPRNITGDTATCGVCDLETCTICKAEAHTGDCPNDTALQQMLETARENGWQRCHSCWRVVELEHGCNHMTCRCGAQFCYVCGEPWKNCACEHWNEHRLYARANQIADRQPDRFAAAVADPVPVPVPAAEIVDEPHGQVTLQEAMRRARETFEHQPVLPAPIEEPQEDVVPEFVVQPMAPTVYDALRLARERLIARTVQNLRENHECAHAQWRWVRGPHQCEECSHYLKQYIFECRQCELQACNRCRRNRL